MGIFRQFPYSNFHEMNLDQIIKIMRQLQDEWTETSAEWSDMRDFINNYFATLDVSQEVLDALRVMLADGTLSNTIDPVIINTTESWLTDHITPTTPPVDSSLTIAGAAADAKTVGDKLNIVDSSISDINNEIVNISGVALPFILELGSLNTNNGNEVDDTSGSHMRSNFISVNSSSNYTIHVSNINSNQISVHILYYNSSKNFISSAFIGYVEGNNTAVKNITTPANTGYIRYRVVGTDLNVNQCDITSILYDFGGVASYKGIITTANLDLNNFVTSGIWQLNDITNYKPDNYPLDVAGKIIVIANNNALNSATVFQFVITYNAGLYYRSSDTNNNWISWRQIAEVRDSLYSYGDLQTADLDMNNGVFIHPTMYSINTPKTYMPKNAPVVDKCRIISFASRTNSQIYTYQILITADNVYTRFAASANIWTSWKHELPYHDNISFNCAFTRSDPFINNYVINRDTGETGRVNRLYALYDAVTDPDVSITKQNLGTDESDTFNIYNYKVSKNTGTKPIVLIIAGEHGDELNSAMVSYYAYREIVTGSLKKYLNFVDFWVIPLMNPYGYEHGTRNNSNNVNLNRDFPAEWLYSESSHNKTGDYSLSQKETNAIYSLIVNNKDNILFICNKHDTGSISSKISGDQPDKVAYVSTYIRSDNVINNGIATYQNNQIRNTDSWIIDECSTDISSLNLIVAREVKTPGSLDLFTNSIGIHGSLIEVCGSAFYSNDTTQYYTNGHRTDLARLGLDFMVNYIAQTIENNSNMLTSDNMCGNVRYYTRTLIDGAYVDTEQYWNGNTLVNI